MALESAGGSIIATIAELMVEPVGRQFRYMFCFNTFVEEFKERKENLVSAKQRLQKGVEAAERNAEETYKDVKKWLEDANNEIEGAKPMESEIGKNGKCFTWCPNCMRQFKLSKALAKKSETFRKLLETKFTKVAHKAPPQPIEFLPSKEFTPSESSKEALEQMMKALKDDNANMIGLYGMGGVGKTTLVKEVGRRAKESQLFPEVLMATVSQNPNVIGIQDRMADSLHLKFEKTSKEGRASELWQRLQGKKMLIILDDVWKHIDLKEIGIPFGDDHRGCKILLTTRRRDICSYMVCQQNVFLGLFSKEEAWDLFRINAGLDDGDSTSNRVARDVARECHGLPIALVTVGKALRDKSEVEWEVAFRQLKNSQFPDMEHIDEQRTAYACLKLSYDYLKSKETKLCFLLCCLFPEDYNIPMEDLTRYAVGYELHQDVESIGDARKRVYVEIKKLKDCSMLLDTETDEHVKMPDLVRDVAIRIASSEEYGFVVKAGIGLKEWPMSIKSFEACTTISLMGNKLTELPEGLECPQLKVLLLKVDDGMNVPERFFEGMKEIEVLSLEGGCLSLQSLELSTKLQSLVLIRCNCKDLIRLRKLQRLKILGLMCCSSIEELPDEIGELKELRLLDVTACHRLRRIPVNLIGRLKKLEELLIGHLSFYGWDVVGCDSTGGMNASLTELNSLSQLAVLSLRIPKVECIPRDFVFPNSLLKYHIILGNLSRVNFGYPTSTRLILDGPSLNAKTFEQLFLHKLESVEVCGCGDVFTLFPARLRQGLKNLKEVVIDSCKSLEEVFELGEADEGSSKEKELPLLSSLTKLRLSRLPEVKCIWKGPTRHVSLQSLNFLTLNSLDKLTFIFTPSLAQSLPKLKRLEISNCAELQHIIREEDGEREIIPESPGFPKLKTIIIEKCGKLEYVLPVSVSPSLLNLEEMRIFEAHNLKQIFYSGEGDARTTDGIIKFPRLSKLDLSSRSNYSVFGPKNFAAQLPSLQFLTINGHKELGNLSAQLQMAAHGQQNGSLQRLERVRVDDCGDVRAPFPAKLLRALKNLKKVFVDRCKSLEEVFELGEPYEGSTEEKEMPLLSSLTTLELQRLPELKCIWKRPTRHFSLQSLNFLTLNFLNKLTFIFTPSLAQSLPKLAGLYISNCAELQHIIREEDGERKIIPESPGFPKLKALFISGCGKLEYVFPVSLSLTLQGLPQLQTLEIKTCGELKHIIKEEDGEREIIPDSPGLPKLKTLHISGCGKLEYVFPVFLSLTLQGLPQLQTLEIKTCGELKHIIKEEDGEREIIPDSPGLPKLKTLHISGCGKLEYVFPVFLSLTLQGLPQLQTLEIKTCGELKYIIREKDGEREIIPDSPGFPKLKTMFINECGKLEYVFPVSVSVSPSLPNLEKMQIFKAHNLKQIFYSGEGDALTTDGIIKFPRLSQLDLSSRSNYSFFGPKNFAAQLPSLQILKINGHKELGNLFAQLQQNDFLQRLESVEVDDCGDVRAPFPAKLLRALKNLKSVEIEDCKSLEEVFELGEPDEGSSEEKELLSSLTMLDLQRLPEVKCIWKGPTRHVSLQSLNFLNLSSLNKLTFIFTQSLAQSLPKLKSLYIRDCGELKHIIREEDGKREIIPESPCFPRLKTIFIKDCGKLEYVFPVSVSPSLPNLEEMTIDRADNLKQIFYSGEGDALTTDGIIKFPRLSKLDLSSRSNYSFFGPKNFAAQLPSLQFLTINGHKELGNLSAQLQMAAHGEQNGSLHRLERVRVDDCGDVRAPFPAKLLQALKNLSSVEIECCESLEEVFELGEADEGISEEKEMPLLSSLTDLELRRLPELKCIWPTGHVSLQSLNLLELYFLDKLTFIFTPSLARSLPQLEILLISECGQLKHVIREEDGEREIIPESPGQDDQASPVNVEKEMVLPNLKELSLEQLSSIVCFSFGWCDYFLFPCLERLKVHHCPKLTTKFATTPDGSMSAQSEVSEVAEDSSINREWTRDNGWEE